MARKKKEVQQGHSLKTYFFTGILVTGPIALTFYVAWKLASYIDTQVISLFPEKYNPASYLPYGLPGLGIVLLIIFLIFVGMLTASYVGRIFARIWDNIIAKMPFVSGLYGALKKVFETILGTGKETAFRQPVLVEFPRRDMWTIAFITGATYKGIQKMFKDELISIYVPTTPNPTSGYFVYVPKKDIKILNIGVDEALKLVISMGIVNPQDGKVKSQSLKTKPHGILLKKTPFSKVVSNPPAKPLPKKGTRVFADKPSRKSTK